MLKRINDFLAGLPMTIVGGIFLIASFVLPKMNVSVDPAWVTVVICGIPLLHLSVWRIIHNKGMPFPPFSLWILLAFTRFIIQTLKMRRFCGKFLKSAHLFLTH